MRTRVCQRDLAGSGRELGRVVSTVMDVCHDGHGTCLAYSIVIEHNHDQSSFAADASFISLMSLFFYFFIFFSFIALWIAWSLGFLILRLFESLGTERHNGRHGLFCVSALIPLLATLFFIPFNIALMIRPKFRPQGRLPLTL